MSPNLPNSQRFTIHDFLALELYTRLREKTLLNSLEAQPRASGASKDKLVVGRGCERDTDDTEGPQQAINELFVNVTFVVHDQKTHGVIVIRGPRWNLFVLENDVSYTRSEGPQSWACSLQMKLSVKNGGPQGVRDSTRKTSGVVTSAVIYSPARR
ncbi:uncharacterized protein BT62DRAFT_1007659 [Guyanagaster necrorhizus]|uniref:Uncharacterized protein n=1 Tax=Guyanagaster necrorhizus TaxID=856835 RepID=A0A9P7VQ55_9AGAR|nr:uncharacterized protein BT62DRAFT_1007659 [Guyanagaster necrorhizus MCA 3950]KAG7444640.1 hypothetical protein BT62DRAFT_1007659 [Guyanagaster necrorhizus MCA 3950]